MKDLNNYEQITFSRLIKKCRSDDWFVVNYIQHKNSNYPERLPRLIHTLENFKTVRYVVVFILCLLLPTCYKQYVIRH